jgi:hypothetical protein
VLLLLRTWGRCGFFALAGGAEVEGEGRVWNLGVLLAGAECEEYKDGVVASGEDFGED